MRNIIIRIILDIAIAVAVVNGFWYIALPLSLGGLWFCRGYVEIILAGIVYDSLFGMVPGMGWRGWVGTMVAVATFLIITGLKKVLRK